MQDIRVALRQLRKSPGFAVTVILTIALGIGANTAIFTLVHAVLLKSLPVADPKTLYRVGDKDDCCVNGGFENDDGDFDLFSYDLYLHFHDTTPEFEQLAAIQSGSNTMNVRRGRSPPKQQRSQYVSGNFFSTFGIAPLPDACSHRLTTPGAAPVGGDQLSGLANRTTEAIPVCWLDFLYSEPASHDCGNAHLRDFSVTASTQSARALDSADMEPIIEGETAHPQCAAEATGSTLSAAVKPGTAPGRCKPKSRTPCDMWLSTQPDYTRNGGSNRDSQTARRHHPRRALAVQNLQQETGKRPSPADGNYLGLVLLVACANIANLLLARGTTRKPETSHPHGLGRGSHPPYPPDADESLLLGCVGGLAASPLPTAAPGLILALAFPDSPNLPIHATPSLPVLAFAFAPVAPHGTRLRHRSRMDHFALRSGRSPARRQPLHARPRISAAKIAHRFSSRTVPRDAGRVPDCSRRLCATSSIRTSASRPPIAMWSTSIRRAPAITIATVPGSTSDWSSEFCSASRRSERRRCPLQHARRE